MSNASNSLQGVEALTFDVFGTVVDWHGSVVRALKIKAAEKCDTSGLNLTEDFSEFAKEWRAGYAKNTKRIAEGGKGSLNVDIMHREVKVVLNILDDMLTSDRWSYLSNIWGDNDRKQLVMSWHRLDGWPDSTKGLHALKKKLLLATLSNGNVRLLTDMARYADLPWDVIFSGELLGSYKPNPKVYQGALHHLSINPSQCAMVAAHIYDLRAAAKEGMRTIYVRRPTEDTPETRESVKAKKDGGEVDIVVDSFEELADLLGCK